MVIFLYILHVWRGGHSVLVVVLIIEMPSFAHSAVDLNRNHTCQLFTYELYMAHILCPLQVVRKAQSSTTASCCVCFSVSGVLVFDSRS